jgi:hypothetical protein
MFCVMTSVRIAAPGSGCRLLADTSIDPLAQQVGMAIVAGVLLDHVD